MRLANPTDALYSGILLIDTSRISAGRLAHEYRKADDCFPDPLGVVREALAAGN